jgi:hypothetical protein
MTDFQTRLERELVAAAARDGRLRYARSPLPTRPQRLTAAALAVCASVLVLGIVGAVALRPAPRMKTPPVQPAPRTPPRGPVVTRSTFAEQLALLSVLRNPTAADRDRQVGYEARLWINAGTPVRADYARLLGKAPKSGKAFVLLPVTRFERYGYTLGGPRTVTEIIYNALCLMRRGTQGGAGTCVSMPEFRRTGIFGALAGQIYGVVPDGVTAVRPSRGAAPVPVRRNFYVYSAKHRNPNLRPAWLDARGNVIGPR